MAGAALLLLALIAIVLVLLAPDRQDDEGEPPVTIPAPRAEDQNDLPAAANEKENA